MSKPNKVKVIDQVKNKAVELLEPYSEGLRFQELKVKLLNVGFLEGTINVVLNNLNEEDSIFKPERGLYKHIKHKPNNDLVVSETPIQPALITSRVKEEDFYQPFADWLQEIEEVTQVHPLGGNKFGDKWTTPDVIGIWKSSDYDFIRNIKDVVSAEIKIDISQLMTAFGQACAYKLFSHKVYLVIPQQTPSYEISRLDSLCQIIGIGLVTFNIDKIDDPSFLTRIRPARHEPDLFYTNKYMKLIQEKFP